MADFTDVEITITPASVPVPDVFWPIFVAPEAPVVSNTTPAPGLITRSATVAFTVSASVGVDWVSASVVYDHGATALVYDTATGFTDAFSTSTVNVTPTLVSFTLRCDAGWANGFTLLVKAASVDDAVATAAYVFDVDGYPFVPTIENVSPEAGATLEKFQAIEFDVIDDTPNQATTIAVYFHATNTDELAWEGDAFTARYSTSTRTVISGGFRYAIRRDAGWLSGGLKLKLRVIDSDGNLATQVVL